jgi:hypothetical protein
MEVLTPIMPRLLTSITQRLLNLVATVAEHSYLRASLNMRKLVKELALKV